MMHRLARVMTLVVFASFATAAAASPFANIPVVGNLTNPTGATATFKGTVDVFRFVFVTPPVNSVEAFVTLTGDVVASGTVIESLDRVPIGPLPVTFVHATCNLLQLQLGSIGIGTPTGNYSGQITTAGSAGIVVPDITATSEAVSDVLCALAQLVGQGGPVAREAKLLNQLIGLLA